jgi:hypothetical protein
MYARSPEQTNAFAAALAQAQSRMVVEVWPENWQALQLFARLSTQWRVGMNGPGGLSYEAAYPLMDRLQLSQDELGQLFADLQVMEQAALTVMRNS